APFAVELEEVRRADGEAGAAPARRDVERDRVTRSPRPRDRPGIEVDRTVAVIAARDADRDGLGEWTGRSDLLAADLDPAHGIDDRVRGAQTPRGAEAARHGR